jgi:hypothetical protein
MSWVVLAGEGEGVMKVWTMSVRSASEGVLLWTLSLDVRVRGVSLVGVRSTTSCNACQLGITTVELCRRTVSKGAWDVTCEQDV